jgi:hypothetical protein
VNLRISQLFSCFRTYKPYFCPALPFIAARLPAPVPTRGPTAALCTQANETRAEFGRQTAALASVNARMGAVLCTCAFVDIVNHRHSAFPLPSLASTPPTSAPLSGPASIPTTTLFTSPTCSRPTLLTRARASRTPSRQSTHAVRHGELVRLPPRNCGRHAPPTHASENAALAIHVVAAGDGSKVRSASTTCSSAIALLSPHHPLGESRNYHALMAFYSHIVPVVCCVP